MAEKSKKRLLLIDGHALLHRAFHAMPELTTSKGERVEAVYGFVRMLLKVVDDLQPTHLAITFDRPVPTFRHKLFREYQAKRPPMDKSLKDQLKRLREVIEAMEIPVYELDGYEADDLLGTLAQKAAVEGEAIIVTGDRDILQLVQGKTITVWTPKRGLSNPIVWDEARFVKEYGFSPQTLVDYKGLVGDSSDNYPGVAGIGDKTAKRLLKQFDSIEGIYQDPARIEEKVRKRLIKGEKDAFMSKDLAQIRVDVPIKLSWRDTRLSDFGTDRLVSLFEELEFGSLLGKILAGKGEEKVDDENKDHVQVSFF